MPGNVKDWEIAIEMWNCNPKHLLSVVQRAKDKTDTWIESVTDFLAWYCMYDIRPSRALSEQGIPNSQVWKLSREHNTTLAEGCDTLSRKPWLQGRNSQYFYPPFPLLLWKPSVSLTSWLATNKQDQWPNRTVNSSYLWKWERSQGEKLHLKEWEQREQWGKVINMWTNSVTEGTF